MGTAQLRGLAGVLDVDIVVITEHDHPRLHLHCADGGNDVSFVSRERVVAAFTGAELRARRMVAIFFDERQHHFSALLQEMNTRTRMLHSSPSSCWHQLKACTAHITQFVHGIRILLFVRVGVYCRFVNGTASATRAPCGQSP